MKLLSLGLNATSLMFHDRWLSLPMALHAGLDAVELAAGRTASAMIHPADSRLDIDAIRARLSAAGITAHAIGAHRDLSEQQQFDEFLLILARAEQLGCPIVTIAVPDGCNEEAFAGNLYHAAARAQALGVTICLENHGYGHGSGCSLLPMLAIHSNLRLCYDTGNVLYYRDSDLSVDLSGCIEHVRHLHLKDKLGGKGVWQFPPIGQGVIPFRNLLDRHDWPALLSASIEIEFTPEGVSLGQTRRAIFESAAYLRNLPLACGDK